ncbi:MAG: hypothetical protein QM786_07070 [Breznakibacter sp.]
MINKYLSDIDNIKRFFKEIIIDTLIQHTDTLISWSNYTAGIPKKMYSKEYENLKYNRQYSFLLKNNGFIQLFFEFNSTPELVKAKLAYYPYPIKLKENVEDLEDYYSTTDDFVLGEYYFDLWNLFQSELGKSSDDEEVKEIKDILDKIGVSEHEVLEEKFNKKYELTNTSHIRFDFDSKVTSHHKFEIQYASLNTLRIPLKQIISPLVFMDFISRHEFPDFYKDLIKNNHYITAYNIALKNSLIINGFKENNIYIIHN